MIKLRRNYLYMTIVILLLIMIPFIGIGFSALTTVLNIRGDFLVDVPRDPIIGNYYKSISNTYLNTQYRDKIKYIWTPLNIWFVSISLIPSFTFVPIVEVSSV